MTWNQIAYRVHANDQKRTDSVGFFLSASVFQSLLRLKRLNFHFFMENTYNRENEMLFMLEIKTFHPLI